MPKFDGVFIPYVLAVHNAEDAVTLLKGCLQIMKPTGRLVVVCPK